MSDDVLSNYQVLADRDDHFYVQQRNGIKFQVAKKHLDADTVGRIQAMYKGGEVQHMAGGGDVAPAGTAEFGKGNFVPVREDASFPKFLGSFLGQGTNALVEKAAEDVVYPAVRGTVKAADALGEFGSGFKQGYAPPAPAPVPDVKLGPRTASTDGTITEIPETVPADQQVPIAEAQAAQVAQAAGGEKAVDPLKAYMGLEKESIKQRQVAEELQAGREVAAQEMQLKALDNIAKAHEAARKPIDDQIKAVSDEVLAGKVNPNKYYQDRSTANHVMGSIAMILGGLAGGLDKTGRNPALEVIQKAIDRDIDAQKENLANKKSGLSILMAQGKSVDEASDMLRLNAMTAASAQLGLAASMSKDPMAKARAAAANAELEFKAKTLKDALAEKNLERAIIAPGGTSINPATVSPGVNEKFAKTTVHAPDGRFYQARSPEAATKLSEKFSNIAQAKSLLAKLGKYGVEGLHSGEAQSDAANLKSILINVMDIGARPDALKMINAQFDNPTKIHDMFITGASKALLSNLEEKEHQELVHGTINYGGNAAPLTSVGKADVSELAKTRGKEAAAKLAQNSKK